MMTSSSGRNHPSWFLPTSSSSSHSRETELNKRAAKREMNSALAAPPLSSERALPSFHLRSLSLDTKNRSRTEVLNCAARGRNKRVGHRQVLSVNDICVPRTIIPACILIGIIHNTQLKGRRLSCVIPLLSSLWPWGRAHATQSLQSLPFTWVLYYKLLYGKWLGRWGPWGAKKGWMVYSIAWACKSATWKALISKSAFPHFLSRKSFAAASRSLTSFAHLQKLQCMALFCLKWNVTWQTASFPFQKDAKHAPIELILALGKVCIKSPWTVVWFSQIVYFICD